jgi:predicted CoA-binding protein
LSEPFRNPPRAELRELLLRARTIAVVGLSPRPARPSHWVSAALQRFGYRIIPVRPIGETILGERVYRDLGDIPTQIDLVSVFRAPEHVHTIVERCLELRLPALWLQDGVVNEVAARRGRAAGMFVVMDRCIYRDYLSLIGSS